MQNIAIIFPSKIYKCNHFPYNVSNQHVLKGIAIFFAGIFSRCMAFMTKAYKPSSFIYSVLKNMKNKCIFQFGL